MLFRANIALISKAIRATRSSTRASISTSISTLYPHDGDASLNNNTTRTTIKHRPLWLIGLVIVPIGLYGGAILHDWIKPPKPDYQPPKDATQASFIEARDNASNDNELYRICRQRQRQLLREKHALEAKIAELAEQERQAINSSATIHNDTEHDGTTTATPSNA
ncbi:hypothetical protein BDF22DRAFT_739431 [Syncephalis plumigaleata]|nr:hypothetical protein BDF22DRAFT_739431 [Syncephalis plumigaleata]